MKSRILLLVHIVLTFLLINLGGYVHNTGSSLACPDWPLCYGQVMPNMEGGILIEHSHRLLASLVGFLTIILIFIVRKKYPDNKKLFRMSIIALVMVIAQGVLGGLTVIFKLPTLVSTSHLALSMIYFLTLIYIHHQMQVLDGKKFHFQFERKWSGEIRNLFFVSLGIIYLQMILGAFMRHLGLGSACGFGFEYSFACFDIIHWVKTFIPMSTQAQIHALHRYLGFFMGVFVSLLSVYSLIKVKNKIFIIPLIAVLAQVTLGVMSVGLHLNPEVTMLHLGGAALLIATLWKIVLTLKTFETENNLIQKHTFLSDLFSLMKPRLSLLVIFTLGVGVVLAPGEITFYKAMIAMFATSFLVGGGCALNCYIERRVDGLMNRTKDRPLPAGRLNPKIALIFGIVLCTITLPLLFIEVNFITGLLGFLAAALYLLVYTPLKRKSTWALPVGAIPGAIPPLMGYTAVTGEIGLMGIILFMVLFMWQLPHFLAISMYSAQDYGNAGIKIVPLIKGRKETKRRIFLYTNFLMVISLSPVFFGIRHDFYTYFALFLGILFVLHAFKGFFIQREEENMQWAKKYFWGSLIYLPSLLFVLLFSK